MSRSSGGAGSGAGGGAAASALPFLSCDSAGRFRLEAPAVALLSSIKGRICPVVVCGPYRTGKSTLLNLLLDRNVKSGAGFAVGGTVQACTKGMWMWGEPLVVDDRTYVFFDSEGLGSTDQHATFDTQLFSLSLLLSSLFVLNTSGTISENALEQLELVVQLTERIKVGGASASAAAGAAGGKGKREVEGSDLASLSAFFPSFLWVLRDFTLELRNAHGQLMSSTDYLEDALRPVPIGPNSKRGAAEKNRIRTAISQVFHTRECVTLVRPVAEERDLQRVSQLANNALRDEFRSQIASLKELIPQLAHPKAIDGVELNGRAFVSLAAKYVASINAGGVPTIRTAFQSVQEIQGREAMDAALQLVQEGIQSQLDSKGEQHVLPEEQLDALLTSIQVAALQTIREQALGTAADIARLEAQFVAKHLSGLFTSLRQRNAARAEKGCTQLISDLWSESGIEDHLPSYNSYPELNRDVSGFWAKFLSLAKRAGMPGRVALESGRTFLDQKREAIFKVLFTRLAKAQEETAQARQASEANQAVVAKLTGELSNARADAQVATRKAELELAAAHKEAARSARDAEGAEKKLRSLEAQLQASQSQHSELSRSHAAQHAKQEARLHSLQADVQRLEREKAQLSEQLQAASHSLTQTTSGASKATKKLEGELAQARAQHEREVASLRAAAEQADTAAAVEAQKLSDANEAVSIQLRTAQQEIASLKASKNSKATEAADTVKQLKQQLKEAETAQAQLQQQLQQERAAAASAAASYAGSSEDNPLGLPTPTRTPLVSRASLIPSKFSTSGAAGSKRKSAAQAVEEGDEEAEPDVDMSGGGAAFGEEPEEEEEASSPPPPAKAKKPTKAAAAASTVPAAAAAAAPASAVAAGNLRDPNAMTINELKSWLTSLDIAFPQKAQAKAWYVDLAYEKLGAPLEQAFPRGAGKKKAKK